MATRFVQGRMIYTEIIAKLIPQTKQRLWIATADIKDMYVEWQGDMVPFLKILADLISKGVEVRLIHAKEPGQPFREDFDRYPLLHKNLERMLCPRVHFKCIIIDGKQAYFGSANLTGAGMGAKSENRRNFENGILTDESNLIDPLSEQFDSVWRGAYCPKCGRRQYCPDCPIA